ncbi:hypothetical protein MASR2M15_18420 [Anaerolineales bacterium]
MKKPLRGLKRNTFYLDFNMYRVEIPYVDYPDQHMSVIDLKPEKVSDTIVFIHGYAGCAETWEYQINHFMRNYRIIVPDLRGHGQSDAPDSQYTMDELVQDIYQIYKKLNLPEKFILVGHSFGGSICVEFAHAYPELLDRLVLIATAGEYPLPRAARYIARIPHNILQPVWRYRPRWNAELNTMQRMLVNNVSKCKGWPYLTDLKFETLVITGQKDTYFPRYVFEDVGKMIPNVEIYDVGASKHKVQLERHTAVNRAIERFITHIQESWRGENAFTPTLESRPWLNHYSKDTPYTVPIPQHPIHHFLEGAAAWKPDKIATIFYGRTLNYRELEEKANQFAHTLIKQGIQKGDRVLVVLPNSPHFIIAFFGILKAGGVAVLPNIDADLDRILHEVHDTSAKAIITLDTFKSFDRLIKTNTNVQFIVYTQLSQQLHPRIYEAFLEQNRLSKLDTEPDEDISDLLFMVNLMTGQPKNPPNIHVEMNDLAVISYTSGTVSEPKGVCLSHQNLVANTIQTRHWIPNLQFGQETFLSVTPFLHAYGMTTAMIVPIAMAASMVLLVSFQLKDVLNAIKSYKPSIFPGIPAMYTAINQAPHIRRYKLGSIKACISGAAPLPVEIQESFEKLTRGRLIEGYGLTEAGPITHANPLYGTRKVGSIGIPIPNTDAKIIDLDTDMDLSYGNIGELLVKGPQVMLGYWDGVKKQIDTQLVKDGWLFTGDIAQMDNNGYFTLINRKSDMISINNTIVFPRDIEEVIYESSKVYEVAVIGIEDPSKQNMKIKAYVVSQAHEHLTEAEILRLCERRLPDYAVPSEIVFIEKLPKSYIGKILRRELVNS